MVLKSADKLMYAANGTKVAVIGQIIEGFAISTSVFIVTVYVKVATFGSETFMFERGAGVV